MPRLEISDPSCSHATLADTLARDGYLFFRDVLDPHVVATARAGIVDWLVTHGLAEDVGGALTWTGQGGEGLARHAADLHRRQLWQPVARSTAATSLIERVLGGPMRVLPLTQYQFKWRGRGEGPIHQDSIINPGLPFLTCWVPLLDMDVVLRGIRVASGMHRHGSLYGTPDETGTSSSEESTNRRYLDESRIPDQSWCHNEYRIGDLLIFDAHMPHEGLLPQDDRIRFSVDFRVIAASFAGVALGPVSRATGDTLEVADEVTGRTVEIRIDESTLVRSDGDYYNEERPETAAFVGRTVLVAHREGNASLVRMPTPD